MYRKVNFPDLLTIPSMIAYTRWVFFAHSVLAGFGTPAAVLNKIGATLPRKVPQPIAIFLTTLLFVALGPFLWLPMETLSLAEQLQAHCWQKLSTFSCCKVAWNSFSPPLRRMNDNELHGENPAKWAWEKGSWGWIFDEMDALHYFFICMYIYTRWMHWFNLFVTKLSKWLWIKITQYNTIL